MAYTIKGLAKANDCEELNEYGLAYVWQYWIENNCNDMQSVKDYKRLRKEDRKEIMNFYVLNFLMLRITFSAV